MLIGNEELLIFFDFQNDFFKIFSISLIKRLFGV